MSWRYSRLRNLSPFLVAALVLCRSDETLAQDSGYVRLNNGIPGVVDAPVFDVDGKTRLEGDYRAELFVGATAANLSGAVSPTRFGSGEYAGYLVEQLYSGYLGHLRFASPGATIFCRLLVWEPARGGDYESAVAAGSRHGQSEVFQVTVGTWENPGLLVGLKSFQLRAPAFGTVDFRNLIPGVLDAPVSDRDGSRPARDTWLSFTRGLPQTDTLNLLPSAARRHLAPAVWLVTGDPVQIRRSY